MSKRKKTPARASTGSASRHQAGKSHPVDNNHSWLELSLCALVLTVPFLWSDSILDPSGLPRNIVIEVGGALLLTVLFYQISRGPTPVLMRIPFLAWPVLAFFIMAIASNGWANHHGSALIETVYLSGFTVLFLLALYAAQTHASFPLLLLRTAVLAGAGVACIGLLQNFGWLENVFYQAAAPASTMVNKNVCAQYLDTLVFPALFLVLVARNNKEIWQWGIAACLILALILASYTRGAWLGLLAGMIILAVYLRVHTHARRDMLALLNPGKYIAMALIVATACLIMAIPSPVHKGTLAEKWLGATTQSEEGGTTIRLALYANTWQMLKEHPLGIGIGNWKHAYPAYSRAVRVTPDSEYEDHLHSDPFAAFVELGWIGGLIFVSIFFAALWSTWQINAATETDRRNRLLALALFIALTDTGAHSLFSFPFHSPTSAMQIWLWLGLLAGISSACNYQKAVNAVFYRIGIALSCLLVVALALYNSAYYKSSALIRDAYIYEFVNGRVNCSLLAHTKAAMDTFPYDARVERLYTGTIFFCDPDRASAYKSLTKALEHEPYFLTLLTNLLPLAYQQNHFDMVLTVAKRLVRVFPWKPVGYHGLGILAWRQGEYKEARMWFMKALEQDKHYSASLDMLNKIATMQHVDKDGAIPTSRTPE